MGLLMLWHKSGILSIEGERGEDNLLDAATVHSIFFSFSIARIERISYKIFENYQKWVDVANSLRYNECSD